MKTILYVYFLTTVIEAWHHLSPCLNYPIQAIYRSVAFLLDTDAPKPVL